jgi:hypothetical protein
MKETKKLGAALIKAKRALDAFRNKHEALFERYDELVAAVADATEELKTVARDEHSGESAQTLLDSPDISVEVRPSYTKPTFSVARAKKYWPENVYSQVRKVTIDSDEVTALAKSGVLTTKLLSKAMENEPELRTKAVYIKVKNG